MSLFLELKRRNVFRVGIAYATARARVTIMALREARQNCERAYELDSNDIGVINLYGDFQGFKLGSLQKIVTECIGLLEADPEDSNGFGYALIAFFSLRWQDPMEVLPWLEKALLEKDKNLTNPVFFYLPERYSDDPAWLGFWNKPELKELLDIRRSYPYPSNGVWLPRIETVGQG